MFRSFMLRGSKSVPKDVPKKAHILTRYQPTLGLQSCFSTIQFPRAIATRRRVPTSLSFQGGVGVEWGGEGDGYVQSQARPFCRGVFQIATFTHKDIPSRLFLGEPPPLDFFYQSPPLDFFCGSPVNFQRAVRGSQFVRKKAAAARACIEPA